MRCRDNGFWGSPFFHDACLQACPTQPTLPPSPTTVLPDPAFVDFSEIADLLVPLEDLPTLLPTPTRLTTEDPEQREGAESGELSGRDGNSICHVDNVESTLWIMASTMWTNEIRKESNSSLIDLVRMSR